MIKAKQLKEIVNRIPDEAYITIAGNDRCDIIGHTERVESYDPILIADLKLSEGFTIVTAEFIDALYNMATNRCYSGE